VNDEEQMLDVVEVVIGRNRLFDTYVEPGVIIVAFEEEFCAITNHLQSLDQHQDC